MIYFAGKKEGRTKGEDEPRPKNIFLAFLRKGFSWFLPRVCPHTDIFLSREIPYANQRKKSEYGRVHDFHTHSESKENRNSFTNGRMCADKQYHIEGRKELPVHRALKVKRKQM